MPVLDQNAGERGVAKVFGNDFMETVAVCLLADAGRSVVRDVLGLNSEFSQLSGIYSGKWPGLSFSIERHPWMILDCNLKWKRGTR